MCSLGSHETACSRLILLSSARRSSGSVVERRRTCALHMCRRMRLSMVARLPWYRCSWPPRVMPYPLALHNNLLRRVCSGISTADHSMGRFVFLPYPGPPLPFRRGPVIGVAAVHLSFYYSSSLASSSSSSLLYTLSPAPALSTWYAWSFCCAFTLLGWRKLIEFL